MSNLYSTKYKLDLANNIIADFCSNKIGLESNNQSLKQIRKIEHKYNKSKGCYCDLSDFCIRLSDLPQIHYKLMLSMNWLDHDSGAPVKSQHGFYKLAFYDKQGLTKTEHFITIDKYTQLLFIELEIKELYEQNSNLAM